jgi:tetratricopeptide (TPR) repeat protein
MIMPLLSKKIPTLLLLLLVSCTSFANELLFKEARTLQREGKFDEAISAYLWAIKIDPSNAYPYNNIAQLYIKMDAYEDAIEYAVKASELKGDMYQAWSAQAICLAMMGYMEDYESAYRRAVACGADGDVIIRFIRSLGCNV